MEGNKKGKKKEEKEVSHACRCFQLYGVSIINESASTDRCYTERVALN